MSKVSGKNLERNNLLQVFFAYLIARVFANSIHITSGIIAEVFSTVLFLYILRGFMKKWLQNDKEKLAGYYIKIPQLHIGAMSLALSIPSGIYIFLCFFKESMVKTTGSSVYTITILALLTFALAIAEEALFRGYMLKKAVVRYGKLWGILYTSILFAIAQISIAEQSFMDFVLHMISFGCLGIVYSIITLESSSIAYSVTSNILCSIMNILISINQSKNFETLYLYVCALELPKWFSNNIMCWARISVCAIVTLFYIFIKKNTENGK